MKEALKSEYYEEINILWLDKTFYNGSERSIKMCQRQINLTFADHQDYYIEKCLFMD